MLLIVRESVALFCLLPLGKSSSQVFGVKLLAVRQSRVEASIRWVSGELLHLLRCVGMGESHVGRWAALSRETR